MPSPIPNRIAWIDAGRGLSILLVVLLHSENWMTFAGFDSEILSQLNSYAIYVRMPLFFLVSGLLASRIVRESSWREIASRRLYLLLWAFLLWQPVVFAYKYLAAVSLPDQEDATLGAHVLRLAISPIRPNGETWFLWALVMFFATAYAVRQISPLVQLVGAAAVSAIWLVLQDAVLPATLVRMIGDGWKGLFTYFFFFLMGVIAAKNIRRWTSRISFPWAALIAVAGVAVIVIVVDLRAETLPGLSWTLRLVGVTTGVAMALLLTRVPFLGYCGSRTLPIYLAHTFFIVLIASALQFLAPGHTTELVSLGTVVATAAAAVLCALALYRFTRGNALEVLFVVPDPVRRALDRMLAARRSRG